MIPGFKYFAFVPGSDGAYRHDMNGNVYTSRGDKVKKNNDGSFPLVIKFKKVNLFYEEIFPYKKIEKEPEKEPEKTDNRRKQNK